MRAARRGGGGGSLSALPHLQQLLDVPDFSALHWAAPHVEVTLSWSHFSRARLNDDLTEVERPTS